MLGLNLPHDTRFGNIPLSQTATVSHGFIPFLARKLCLEGKSPGKISSLTILDNKIFHLELQNVAKHCAISSECSSPHDPKGFSSHSFIQHPLLALFLLADVKTIHQECEPQYVQYRNCSDNSPGVSSGRHSLVGRRHHLCRLDSYREVLQAQGRGVVKFC